MEELSRIENERLVRFIRELQEENRILRIQNRLERLPHENYRIGEFSQVARDLSESLEALSEFPDAQEMGSEAWSTLWLARRSLDSFLRRPRENHLQAVQDCLSLLASLPDINVPNSDILTEVWRAQYWANELMFLYKRLV